MNTYRALKENRLGEAEILSFLEDGEEFEDAVVFDEEEKEEIVEENESDGEEE